MLPRRWRPDVWFGCLMAVFWMGAVAIYGVASVYLGTLGTSVGWALFQIFMIMTANLVRRSDRRVEGRAPCARSGRCGRAWDCWRWRRRSIAAGNR